MRVEKSSKIDEGQFEKYEPLLDDIKTDNRAAMLGFLLINSRRLVMLFMAMFVEDKQWVQIQLFIFLNFLSLTYQVTVNPF